jgi:hypothetical protein
MSFDVSRLRRADQIVGGGAIAFFIFLFFFHWLGVSASSGAFGGISVSKGLNGWHAFTNSRWIWLIAIVVALIAVARRAGALSFELPVSLSAIVAGLGALSTILILYRIIHHPHGSESLGSVHASAGIRIGIWLGLIAAAALTYGAYLAMRDEGTSIADVREQAGAALGNLAPQAAGPSGGAPTATGQEVVDTEKTRVRDVPTPPAEAASPPIPPPASEPPSSA